MKFKAGKIFKNADFTIVQIRQSTSFDAPIASELELACSFTSYFYVVFRRRIRVRRSSGSCRTYQVQEWLRRVTQRRWRRGGRRYGNAPKRPRHPHPAEGLHRLPSANRARWSWKPRRSNPSKLYVHIFTSNHRIWSCRKMWARVVKQWE